MTRTAPANPIVLIPARLAATRLPGKPLADIAGTPMIVHVWRRAVAAELGPVIVACADRAIADAVESAGGRAVLTAPDHATGSDRIHEAIGRIDPSGRHDAVINVQGDLPLLDPAAVRVAVAGLADPETDIATLAAIIEDEAALAMMPIENSVAGRVADIHHLMPDSGLFIIGEHFERVNHYLLALPGARLEQLRALEAGMHISVCLVDPAQLGVQVDTPADLARARALMESGL